VEFGLGLSQLTSYLKYHGTDTATRQPDSASRLDGQLSTQSVRMDELDCSLLALKADTHGDARQPQQSIADSWNQKGDMWL
jgi:hypothetical protein